MAYLYIPVFIVGLFFLLNGASLITKRVHKFAKDIGIADIVIGMTLVSLTTSLPELALSLSAAFSQPEISLGVVVGSNITNIVLVLGLAAIITPPTTNGDYLKRTSFLIILTIISSVSFSAASEE